MQDKICLTNVILRAEDFIYMILIHIPVFYLCRYSYGNPTMKEEDELTQDITQLLHTCLYHPLIFQKFQNVNFITVLIQISLEDLYYISSL